MKLVESKKLKLTTPLARFFPKIKNSSRITIEHMLKHRSGIFNFTNTDEYLNYMEKPLGREELLAKIIEFGSVFEPNEEAEYSNSNFVLLSMIAERVTKKSFTELVEDLLSKPLGLDHTYVGSIISPSDNEAKSFKKMKIWEDETETDMSIPLGAGSIVSSASDVNTFLAAFFADKIVTEDSRKKMMSFQEGFGMGLLQLPFYDKMGFGHNGAIDGFQSMAYHFPKDGISVTYLANGVVHDINDIILDALKIYFGKEMVLPEFLPVMQLSTEELEQYTGKYVSADLPIDLSISIKGSQLMGQASGQQSFLLDAVDINKFKCDPARLTIEFFPKENKMTLIQGGKSYNMIKE